VAVYAFLVSMGAFQLIHSFHTGDFVAEASYSDLAKSLPEPGSYQADLYRRRRCLWLTAHSGLILRRIRLFDKTRTELRSASMGIHPHLVQVRD